MMHRETGSIADAGNAKIMAMTRYKQVRDLVYILTLKEIKTRYKSSVFGYIWSLANPLAYALIFYFAFGIIFRFKVENYALFLICGLFPWQWLNNSITSSTRIFLQNASLIKKSIFPRYILQIANCLQDGFHFLMTIPVIFIFLLVHDVELSPVFLVGIPLLVTIQFIMVFGASLVMGTLNVFFRDIDYMTQILFQMLFYLTPILYPLSKVPEEYSGYILFNPFAPIVLAWKDLYLEGNLNEQYILLSVLYSFLTLGIGVFVYRKLSWKFAEAM